MIQKVLLFFSTYNIMIGIIITILALSTLEIIRSLSNDIIIPMTTTDLEKKTSKICGKVIKTGIFYGTLYRFFLALMFILMIIYVHPFEIKD